MWALNEVAAMVQKAARGAGIALGQAEDLGRIATYLAATGDDVGAITAALQTCKGTVDVKWGVARIDVISGPAALIAPIVRDAFEMGCDVAGLANQGHVPLVLGALRQAGVGASAEGLIVRRSSIVPAAMQYGAVIIPDDDWALWSRLAAQTYVPESAASRAAGAGAGLTDND